MRNRTLGVVGASTMVVALLAASSCKKAKDAAETALSDDPQTSYCETVCNWGVECHSADRDIDADAVLTDCLTATEALNSDCAAAEAGELSAESRVILDECNEALAEDAADCSPFTGSFTEQSSYIPPASCLTLDPPDSVSPAGPIFNEARNTTAEGGDEMCERFTTTICEKLTTCLLGDFEVPDEAVDSLGSPQEICEEKLSSLTDKCLDSGLYDMGDYNDLTDQNLTREAAGECLDAYDDMECSGVFSTPPAVCSGAFASTEDATSMAGGILETACVFEAYVPELDGLCG